MRDVTTNNNEINVLPTHPEPIADTSTPYDDDEEIEKYDAEEKNTIDLEKYFEIIMMISPVAGVKLYLHRYEPTNNHILPIKKQEKNIEQEAP